MLKGTGNLDLLLHHKANMKFIVITILMFLSACGAKQDESPPMPDGLKDCKPYYVGNTLVIRCPASSVTTYERYLSGKIYVTRSALVIDVY